MPCVTGSLEKIKNSGTPDPAETRGLSFLPQFRPLHKRHPGNGHGGHVWPPSSPLLRLAPWWLSSLHLSTACSLAIPRRAEPVGHVRNRYGKLHCFLVDCELGLPASLRVTHRISFTVLEALTFQAVSKLSFFPLSTPRDSLSRVCLASCDAAIGPQWPFFAELLVSYRKYPRFSLSSVSGKICKTKQVRAATGIVKAQIRNQAILYPHRANFPGSIASQSLSSTPCRLQATR
jgi:hypothetical protein